MDCTKEDTIIGEEMTRNRKKKIIRSIKTCEVSAHLSRKKFRYIDEKNQQRFMRRRQSVNYISDEEDASK